MANKKPVLTPTVDATQAVDGLKKIDQAGKDLGASLEKSGEQGGKGLGAVGEGAEQGAQKVDRATKSIISSIERATAAAKAGGRNTAEFYEALGSTRGVNGAALQPYIDALRQAELAQRNAVGSLDKMGMSAKQTANALRQVPAQFQDIIVGLQGGQAPLTVFLQQGSQLSTVFGGAGVAARALGSYVLGLVNPFTVAAAAGAGLALAYNQGANEGQAFRKALIETGGAAGVTASQLSEGAAAITRFGVTQGKAAEEINKLAAAGVRGAVSLERYAAAALGLERAGSAAADATNKAFEDLGKAPLQASVKLNEAMNYLTRSTYEHIKSLDEQGRHTEAAKAAQDAFAASLEQRTPQLLKNLGYVEHAWLAVKDAVLGVGSAIAGIGRDQTDAESLKALQSQLAARQERNSSLGIKDGKATQDLQEQLNLLSKRVLLTQEAAAAEGLRADQVKAGIAWDKEGEQYLSKAARLRRDITAAQNEGIAAGRTQEEIDKRIAAIREKAGPASGENELASLRAKIRDTQLYIDKLKSITDYTKAQAVENAKLNDGERMAVELQEKLRTSVMGTTRSVLEQELVLARKLGVLQRQAQAEEDQQKAIKKSYDEYVKLIAAVNSSAQSIEEQARKQEAANAVFGKGTSAIEAMTLAQLRHQLAEADSSDSFDQKYIAGLEAKIKAQERFVAALQKADYKTLNQGLDDYLRRIEDEQRISEEELSLAGLTRLERAKIVAHRKAELELARQLAVIDKADLGEAEKEALRAKARGAAVVAAEQGTTRAIKDDWVRTSDEINRRLTDAIIRGFDSGKDAAKTFRDMVNDLVLRPKIEAQVKELTSKLSPSDLSTLGDIAIITDVLSSASGGKWGAAAGQAIGAYVGGPLGAAIGKTLGTWVDKLFSGDAGTPHMGGSSLYSAATGLSVGAGVAGVGSKAGFYSSEAEQLTTQLAKGIVGILDTTAITFGKAAGFAAATGFADDTSKDGAWGALVIKQMDKTLTDWDQNRANEHTPREFADGQAGAEQYIAAVVADTRKALEGIGLPDWAKSMLDKIGASPSIDQFGAVVDQINAIQQAMVSFGRVMPQIAGLTGNAVSDLVQTFGGADAFTQAGAAYYDQFYTEAQKTANVTSTLTTALGGLGLALPTTRDAFRGLVEQQDLNTEAGRKAYATLLQLAPAFAQITSATEEFATAAGRTAAEIAQAGRQALASLAGDRAGLEVELLRAQGNTAGADALARQQALAKITEGLSAADIVAATAAFEYNESLRAQAVALNAATAAQTEATARAAAVANERFGLEGQLLQIQGNTAALRERELATLNETNRGLQLSIYAEQESRAIAAQRLGLEGQLLQVQGNTAELRARELAALDETNRALQQRIYDEQDAQALAQQTARASELAAQALQHVADVLADLGSTRFDLENQLLGLQGNSEEVARRTRERDLAQLTVGLGVEDAAKVAAAYDLNAALRQQIAATEAAQRAAEELAATQARAAEEAARAAEQFKNAWQSVTDSIFSEVARIRGLINGQSPLSFANAQAQFAIATGQARAGDQEAAKLLPGLSQSLLTLAEAQATSLLELQRIRAQAAGSLDLTASLLASRFGLSLPRFDVGTNYVPQDMTAIVHQGEAIVPRAYNPSATAQGRGSDMRLLLEEITALREDARVQALRVVQLQTELNRIVKRWDLGGLPEERTTGATA